MNTLKAVAVRKGGIVEHWLVIDGNKVITTFMSEAGAKSYILNIERRKLACLR